LVGRLGRYAEIPPYLEEGAEYGRDHDFPTHEHGREAYRYRLLALHGDWDAAEQGLREVLGDPDDPGVLDRHALPALARLAVRRGRQDAEGALAAARRNAQQADSLLALVPTAAAELEHAWLTGRRELALSVWQLLPRTERVGRERDRGELLRYLRRLGEPVEAFPGCPEEYAAGLRGDWQAAASAWERVGDPYERALELAESGEVAPTLEALAEFDRLGARPAAARTRRQLRALGVTAVPRGPTPATRNNPSGLTDRQVEILRLLASGRLTAKTVGCLAGLRRDRPQSHPRHRHPRRRPAPPGPHHQPARPADHGPARIAHSAHRQVMHLPGTGPTNRPRRAVPPRPARPPPAAA
jgi:hypothetical protein